MAGRFARNTVRTLVAIALLAALAGSSLAPVPKDLPTVALGQPNLYRLEIAFLAFYGILLLITPTFSGLIHGRLPIEISTRGAKFAEEANHSDGRAETEIRELKQKANDLTEGLAMANIEINRLKGKVEVTERD